MESGVDETIWKKVVAAFEEVSKEELLAKLVKIELGKLNAGGWGDLNDNRSSRREDSRGSRREDRPRDDRRNRSGDSRRSERNDRSERRGRDRDERPRRETGDKKLEDGSRYFINIGTRDKVGKKDLKDFICDVGQLKRSDVGQIEIHKSHAYFEVDTKVHKKVAGRFKGFVLADGRPLRVNRDN